ncbi:MAG: hypothetical protein ACFCGT_08845 [Sandaracinaceae bacterium]
MEGARFETDIAAEAIGYPRPEPAVELLEAYAANEVVVEAEGPALAGEAVFLRASTAQPIDGVRFRWTQVGGPPVQLRDADQPRAWFFAPYLEAPEDIELEITVDHPEDGPGWALVAVHIHGGTGPEPEPEPMPPPAPVPGPEFVVFAADKDVPGRVELYRVDLDGENLARLNAPLVPNADVGAYAISPDKCFVAYVAATADSVGSLFVAHSDGASVTRVSPVGTRVLSFTWAPDSHRLAFLMDGDPDWALASVEPDGDGLTPVNGPLVPGGVIRTFAWSPDSRSIAYIAQQNILGVEELFVSRGDGEGNRRLNPPLPPEGDVVSFLWSPTSRRIAYRADQARDGLFELWGVDRDGSDGTRLSGDLPASGATVGFVQQFSWSVSGDRIAYLADQVELGVLDVYTTRADGTDNTRVAASVPGISFIRFFRWLPDGDTLAYLRSGLTTGTVVLTGPEGQATRPLVEDESLRFTFSTLLQPSPDGQWLLLYERGIRGRTVRLRLFDLEGGPETLIAEEPSFGVQFPRWSSDGAYVTYAQRSTVGSMPFQLLTYRPADGANPVVSSLPSDLSVSGYLWSPSGERLVYGGPTPSAPRELFVTAPDGSIPVLAVSGFLTPGGSVRSFRTE